MLPGSGQPKGGNVNLFEYLRKALKTFKHGEISVGRNSEGNCEIGLKIRGRYHDKEVPNPEKLDDRVGDGRGGDPGPDVPF